MAGLGSRSPRFPRLSPAPPASPASALRVPELRKYLLPFLLVSPKVTFSWHMSVTDCHILNPPCSCYWLPPYSNACIQSSIQFPAASCQYPIIYCCLALFHLERYEKRPASKSVTKAASHNSSSAFTTGARLGHLSFYVLWHTQAGNGEHSKVKF